MAKINYADAKQVIVHTHADLHYDINNSYDNNHFTIYFGNAVGRRNKNC